jgi:hypothetical protein
VSSLVHTLLTCLRLSLNSSSGVFPRAICATEFLPRYNLQIWESGLLRWVPYCACPQGERSVCMLVCSYVAKLTYLLSRQSMRISLNRDARKFSKDTTNIFSYSSTFSRRDSISFDLRSLPFPFVFVRDTTLFLFDRGMFFELHFIQKRYYAPTHWFWYGKCMCRQAVTQWIDVN